VSAGAKTSPSKAQLESLARGYTEQCIRRLGGFVTADGVPEATAIEAAKVLLDRGYGRPKQQKELSGPDGEPINLVIRNLVEELREKSEKP
jgi:hypothetical protein